MYLIFKSNLHSIYSVSETFGERGEHGRLAVEPVAVMLDES
jgi:hypothetical protein